MVIRCKHGLIKEQCSLCQRSIGKPSPGEVLTRIDKTATIKIKPTEE